MKTQTVELFGQTLTVTLPETEGERFGYPAGCDLFECLWYSLIYSLRSERKEAA